MKILFVVPYPAGKAPSQRFRFEQYLPLFAERGWQYKLVPFLDDATWNILYKPGHTFEKGIGVLSGFFRRFFLLFSLGKYDFLFIHREATPIGPPWFEWVASQILCKKVIYDFDDAIWLANTSDNNRIISGIKWHQKVSSICKWAYKVSCGNEYLCNYAKDFNRQIILNPTTIDTERLHNPRLYKSTYHSKPVIGWTGTHSTLPYLEPLVPVLQKLEQEFDFEFCVIANKKPDFQLKSLTFVPWRKETEIPDLMRFDIGVMPLTDDKWANGKCGFKALQYMALGIPALVSPVGVNIKIVDDGNNGFICGSLQEWENALSSLMRNQALREKMGVEARKKILENYSVLSNTRTFLGFFK